MRRTGRSHACDWCGHRPKGRHLRQDRCKGGQKEDLQWKSDVGRTGAHGFCCACVLALATGRRWSHHRCYSERRLQSSCPPGPKPGSACCAARVLLAAPAESRQAAPARRSVSFSRDQVLLKGQEAGAKQCAFTGKDGRVESRHARGRCRVTTRAAPPQKFLRGDLPIGHVNQTGTRFIVDGASD